MYRKGLALVLMVIASIVVLSGCGQPIQAQDTPLFTATPPEGAEELRVKEMRLVEAVEIARGSECVEVGALTDNATLNEWTGTWWIDLDADKPGCASACVVNIADKTAEVNWRCTGALPPQADAEGSGTLGATAPVLEDHPVDEAPPVVCWGGFIQSLPNGAQFDDYLSLEGEQGVGIEGVDNSVAAQIQVARDGDAFVHVWGDLHCPAMDYGGCQLVVTQLREDKPGP